MLLQVFREGWIGLFESSPVFVTLKLTMCIYKLHCDMELSALSEWSDEQLSSPILVPRSSHHPVFNHFTLYKTLLQTHKRKLEACCFYVPICFVLPNRSEKIVNVSWLRELKIALCNSIYVPVCNVNTHLN